MKAIVQSRYGSPDVLTLDDVEQPVPAADEVLVRVRAASLNARDWHLMRGDPYIARLSPGVRPTRTEGADPGLRLRRHRRGGRPGRHRPAGRRRGLRGVATARSRST